MEKTIFLFKGDRLNPQERKGRFEKTKKGLKTRWYVARQTRRGVMQAT